MSEQTSNNLPEFTGTEVGYFFICKKKLWWFAHGLEMEQTSDRVKLGKVVHEESYARQKKEISIDGKIVLDWRDGDNTIHEVKLTDKMENAHEFQLLYYLYYLKQKGIAGLRGQIDYPKLKQTKTVELTAEREAELETALAKMRQIVGAPVPPDVEWMRICAACAYAELCWS